MQNVNVSAPIIHDLQAQPMNGGYALSRVALIAGLKAIDKLWRDVARSATYDPIDYQLAQASLAVSVRYAPSVPPVSGPRCSAECGGEP